MDFNKLGSAAAKSDTMSRATVSGRVLQDDTDFLCYQCAHVDHPLQYAIDKLLESLDHARRVAGASKVNMHLTLGAKGGRTEMATVKPYQEQRKKKDPVLAQRVLDLRNALANLKHPLFTPVVNTTQEADDSLRQYQCKAIQESGKESSVMRSGDKDLWFAEGLHIDANGRFYEVDGYGVTEYKEVGNTKPKLIGKGTSWFWHQMLMGDGADNIPGLPQLPVELLNRYLPLKKHNPKRKPAACGEAKAVAILKDVTTEFKAAQRVAEAYNLYYGANGMEMLVEQAFLLWIRRTTKLTDVLDYLNNNCGLKVNFSKAQKVRLQKFAESIKDRV